MIVMKCRRIKRCAIGDEMGSCMESILASDDKRMLTMGTRKRIRRKRTACLGTTMSEQEQEEQEKHEQEQEQEQAEEREDKIEIQLVIYNNCRQSKSPPPPPPPPPVLMPLLAFVLFWLSTLAPASTGHATIAVASPNQSGHQLATKTVTRQADHALAISSSGSESTVPSTMSSVEQNQIELALGRVSLASASNCSTDHHDNSSSLLARALLNGADREAVKNVSTTNGASSLPGSTSARISKEYITMANRVDLDNNKQQQQQQHLWQWSQFGFPPARSLSPSPCQSHSLPAPQLPSTSIRRSAAVSSGQYNSNVILIDASEEQQRRRNGPKVAATRLRSRSRLMAGRAREDEQKKTNDSSSDLGAGDNKYASTRLARLQGTRVVMMREAPSGGKFVVGDRKLDRCANCADCADLANATTTRLSKDRNCASRRCCCPDNCLRLNATNNQSRALDESDYCACGCARGCVAVKLEEADDSEEKRAKVEGQDEKEMKAEDADDEEEVEEKEEEEKCKSNGTVAPPSADDRATVLAGASDARIAYGSVTAVTDSPRQMAMLAESHSGAPKDGSHGNKSNRSGSALVSNKRLVRKRDTSIAAEEPNDTKAQEDVSHRRRQISGSQPPISEPIQEALVLSAGGVDDADLPSHGGSLAKWKLMQKSEPSMISSALINGKANLVCDIQAPSPDDSVALVLWYKDDSLAPIYTIDARKVGSLDKAKMSLDEQYSSRLSFNMRTKPAQLELANLRQEDEGEYRCRVDFKRGRTVNTIISLRIIVPPSELAIYLLQAPQSSDSRTLSASDSHQQHNHHGHQQQQQQQQQQPYKPLPLVKLNSVNGTSGGHFGGLKSQGATSGQPIGPFDEDADLELLCQARGGKPRPQLQWRRDFNVINTTASTANYLARHMHLADQDETSAVLRVSSLNRQHLLSIFTCQASNNNLTSPLQSSITLDLNLKPQEVTLRRVQPVPSSNVAAGQTMATGGPLLIGQTATFECTSTGSRPQATIHWLFQGQRHDSPMNVDQQQTSSKLTLVLQRSFNQQPLTCVAENPRIASSTSSSSSSSSSSPPSPSLSLATGSTTSTNGAKQTTIKLDVHYPPQLSIRLDKRHHYSLAASDQQAAEPSGAQDRSGQSVDPLDGSLADNEPSTNRQAQAQTQAQVQQQGALVDASLLQEGNDIYLTCHMDANPRPLKPIVWRFNGRPIASQSPGSGGSTSTGSAIGQALLQAHGNPQHQEQGAIVMSNQSLVLRKVRRHQSGSYTCEASNQHGSNTSLPFELVVRHAPVCSTNDIVVLEAAVGQTVGVDCQVQANPATSVHYSWFASLGHEQNLTDWLLRDAVLDEQIDENSSLLKFKIRDKNSFGLLKCRAKNAIGLQQKECLFQISPAIAPALHHTCSLATTSDGTGQHRTSSSSSSNSLQVECKLSEHLKTNQEQQQQLTTTSDGNNAAPPSLSSSSSSSAFKWMKNFRAIKQSLDQQLQMSGHPGELGSAIVRMPQMRRIYPPDWLLAEVYRAKEASSGSSSSPELALRNSESSGNADVGTIQAPTSEISYELQAYVIVGASEQLAKIKSIVEENKLFQANPRDIYYVMAKQAHQRRQHDNEDDELAHQNQLMSMLSESSQHGYRSNSNQLYDISGASDSETPMTIVSDSSIELADEFNFTVPNLEPNKRYKLLIYGQNLANKTRDWQAIRGETDQELLQQSQPDNAAASKQRAKSAAHSFKAVHFRADQEATGDEPGHSNYSSSPLAQKSLVLRSDLNDEKVRGDGGGGGGGDTQQDSPPSPSGVDDTPPGSSSSSLEATSGTAGGDPRPETASESSSISRLRVQSKWAQVPRLSQFSAYSEQALAYAKQRPLLTIPAALIGCLVLVLLVVYLSGLFVGLLKRGRRSSDSMSNDSSTSCGGSSNSCAGGAGNDGSATDRARRCSHKRKASGRRRRAKQEDDHDGDDEDEAKDQDQGQDNAGQLGGGSGKQFGSAAAAGASSEAQRASSSECQSPANLNSSASLIPDTDSQQQFVGSTQLLLQQQQRLRTATRMVSGLEGATGLDLGQPLDAIALQQVAQGDGSNSAVTWLSAADDGSGACDDGQDLHNSGQLASGDPMSVGHYQFVPTESQLQQRFMGSLDRRRQVAMLTNGDGICEPTVYLTQADANYGHHHHHQQQFEPFLNANGNRLHGHFGSIDRRSVNIPSYFIQEHQSYNGNGNKTASLYQPLFIHTASSDAQANGNANDMQQSYRRGIVQVQNQKHRRPDGDTDTAQPMATNSDNGGSFSSSNECTISQMNQLLRHQPVAAIRRGTASKQHNGQRQQQAGGGGGSSGGGGGGHTAHRVAFDLSNQIHRVATNGDDIGHHDEPQLVASDNLAECERAFQSLIKCQQDASSGSNNSTATTNTTADSGHESPSQLLLAGATNGNGTTAAGYLLSSGAYDTAAKSYSMKRTIKQQQLPICQKHMFLVQDDSQQEQALLDQYGPMYGRVQKVMTSGGPCDNSGATRTNCPMVNGKSKSRSLARRHRQQQQQQQQQDQNMYQNGGSHAVQQSGQVVMQLLEFASPSSQESCTLMHSIDSYGDRSPSLTNTATTTTTTTNSNGGSHMPIANDMQQQQQQQQEQLQLQELESSTRGKRVVDANGESMALMLQQNHQMATSFKASANSDGGSKLETSGRVLGQG